MSFRIVIIETSLSSGVSGCAKNLLDHFSSALRKKWFAVIGAAGSEKSLYALNSFCMEIALESGALFFPKLTIATQRDFDKAGNLSAELASRLEDTSSFFVSVAQQLPRLEKPVKATVTIEKGIKL